MTYETIRASEAAERDPEFMKWFRQFINLAFAEPFGIRPYHDDYICFLFLRKKTPAEAFEAYKAFRDSPEALALAAEVE